MTLDQRVKAKIVGNTNGGCRLLSATNLLSLKKNLEEVVCGNNVVFHHIPKCGGTSVYRSLGTRYALSFARTNLVATYAAIEALYPDLNEDSVREESVRFREILLLVHMHTNTRCIAGHFPFSDAAYKLFADRYKFITILRDPVSFFLSYFYWNVKADDERWQIDESIATFLETPRAKRFGEYYARFFRGVSSPNDTPIDQIVHRAKENLAKCSAIGFTDDMSGFSKRISDVLGVRVRIGHENKSSVASADRLKQLSPELRRQIEQLSEPNFAIYNFARERAAI